MAFMMGRRGSCNTQRQLTVSKVSSIFWIVLALLLTSCFNAPEPHVKIAEELLYAFGSEMAQEYDLALQGSGGSMPRTIDELEVLFTASRKASREEAGLLIERGMEKLLEKINGSEKIRPYLQKFPFPSDKISLSFSFERSEGNVVLAYKAGNEIIYYTYNPKTGNLEPLK